MSYSTRFYLICSDADRQAANEVAAEVTGEVADLNTFTVELRDSNDNVWWGAATAATDEMRVAMAVRLGQGRVPSVKFWRFDVLTDLLLQTNVVASLSKVGSTLGWWDALADVGLHYPA